MENPGQYEGFAFFWNSITNSNPISKLIGLLAALSGIGVFVRRDAIAAQLFLLFVVVGTVFLVGLKARAIFLKMILPITLVLAAYTIFALSNEVFIGDRRLFGYGIPSPISQVFAVARTSGRFIWPIMYLAMLCVIYMICKSVGKTVAVSVLLVALLLQIADSSRAYKFTQDVFSREGPQATLVSSTWNIFGSKYTEVNFVPTAHKPRLFATNPDFGNVGGWLWSDIGVLGQKYDWSLNSFYFGRSPNAALENENSDIEKRVRLGEFEPNVLYVFIDSDEWELAKSTAKAGDLVGILDGVPIIAPGLASCKACLLQGFEFPN